MQVGRGEGLPRIEPVGMDSDNRGDQNNIAGSGAIVQLGDAGDDQCLNVR